MSDPECPVCLLVWLVFGDPGVQVRCKLKRRHTGPHKASVWGLTSMKGGSPTIEWHDGVEYTGPVEATDLRLTWRSPPAHVGRPRTRPRRRPR